MTLKLPSAGSVLDRADRVELFSVTDRSIIPEQHWPDAFWPHVGDRRVLVGADAKKVIDLYRGLERGMSARCHMPPWGLALYEGETLLLTVTLCYQCNNAYIYERLGKSLRAFDAAGKNAKALRKVLEQQLRQSE